MEKPGVFTMWEGVKRYWSPERTRELVVALWYEFKNIRPKLVAPDVAFVFFNAEWDIKALMDSAANDLFVSHRFIDANPRLSQMRHLSANFQILV